MMNTYKLELNDKLASLYGLDSSIMTDYDIYGNDFEVLLIDDSARMFDLMIENKLSVLTMDDGCMTLHYKEDSELSEKFMNKDHETTQAAARYAIGMALIKLAEDKS